MNTTKYNSELLCFCQMASTLFWHSSWAATMAAIAAIVKCKNDECTFAEHQMRANLLFACVCAKNTVSFLPHELEAHMNEFRHLNLPSRHPREQQQQHQDFECKLTTIVDSNNSGYRSKHGYNNNNNRKYKVAPFRWVDCYALQALKQNLWNMLAVCCVCNEMHTSSNARACLCVSVCVTKTL